MSEIVIGGKMVKIRITFLLIVMIFILSSVHALEFIENDISGYNLSRSSINTPDNFFPVNKFKYYNYETNNIVNVQLIVFNKSDETKSDLDGWITIHVKDSRGKLNINGSIVYIGYSDTFVFWRNGETYIKVTEKRQKRTSDKNTNPLADTSNSRFDEDIISEYLQIYLSECDEDGCVPPIIKSNDEIYTFDDPPNLFWKVKQHVNTHITCPEENSIDNIKEKVKDYSWLSEEDKQNLKTMCDNSGRFTVEAIQPSSEIKDCYDYLFSMLAKEGLRAHKSWLYNECYIRKYFKERFNDATINKYNSSYFENRFKQRDDEFIDLVGIKKEYGSLDQVQAEGKGKVPTEDEPEIILVRNESGDLTEKYEYGQKVNTKIIPKNMVSIIKERIIHFINWLI